MSKELTLSMKLEIWMGKMTQRSDTRVEKSKVSLGEKLSKWEGILPENMLRFYRKMNGACFFYTFDADYHGVSILGLDSKSKKVYHTDTMTYSLPYTKAKKLGEYFLENYYDISEDSDILFFIGHDSAWGVIMEKDKNGIDLFYKWNNDGDVSFIKNNTFTEIIEQGIARHFGTNWIDDEVHPENQKLIASLKEEAPKRKTFELELTDIKELTGSAYRNYVGRHYSSYYFSKLMIGLGYEDLSLLLSQEEQGKLFEEATADLKTIKAATIKEVFKIKSKKDFKEEFRYDMEPVWQLNIRFKKEFGEWEIATREFLLRALHSIADTTICHDFPLHEDMLLYTHFARRGNYNPFLAYNDDLRIGDEKMELNITIVVTKDRIKGLNKGDIHDIFVLDNIYASNYEK